MPEQNGDTVGGVNVPGVGVGDGVGVGEGVGAAEGVGVGEAPGEGVGGGEPLSPCAQVQPSGPPEMPGLLQ